MVTALLVLASFLAGGLATVWAAMLFDKYLKKSQVTARIVHIKDSDTFVVHGSLEKLVRDMQARRFQKPGAIKYID